MRQNTKQQKAADKILQADISFDIPVLLSLFLLWTWT